MSSNLDKVRDSFIETAGHLGSSLGLNPTTIQIYALLYLSNEPVSLDEMVSVLGASKGNVSINIRILERWGAVKKIWAKGERRDFYIAESDAAGVAVSRLKEGLNRRLSEVTDTIGQLEKTLKSMKSSLAIEEKRQARTYLQKLSDIKKASTKFKRLLKFAGLTKGI